MPPKPTISTKMKKIRRDKKLTQAQLAKLAGINANYYARIERDEENPSIEVIRDIATALEVKSCEFLDF